MNTRTVPHKGFSLQPDASAPAAVSRLSRAVKVADFQHGDAGLERGMDGHDGFRVAGVPIAARHAMQPSPISETPGPFRPNRTSRISISPDFRRAILNK